MFVAFVNLEVKLYQKEMYKSFTDKSADEVEPIYNAVFYNMIYIDIDDNESSNIPGGVSKMLMSS